MNWGKWIIVSFVLFALFIGVLVGVCLREDISLVSKNYYQEELNYQQQIERMNNANELVNKPTIVVKGVFLDVQFDQFNNLEQGELKLFRPSDEHFDRKYVLSASPEGMQQFDISSLPKGMYHVRMLWTMKGKEYFIDNTITL